MNAHTSPTHFLTEEPVEEQQLEFQPKQFTEYIGQQELKNKLEIYAKAATLRHEPLDHILLFGPPGLGKTTLAHIMARVMGVRSKVCSGPLLQRTGDLVAILSSLERHDILFIDEIHRMPASIEETLYNAMEQFHVEVIVGQGAGAHVVHLPLQPFTLVGATTKAGMISAPLRSRFGIVERLDYYSTEDLAAIVHQSAQFLGITFNHSSAQLIAHAARGTPRIAKKLVRRIRDFIQVSSQPTENTSSSTIDEHTTIQALAFLGIDQYGLTTADLKLLSILIKTFNGGPTGLETLAAMIGEDTQTMQDVIEPYLLRCGYLEKTPRGRQVPANMIPYISQQILNIDVS